MQRIQFQNQESQVNPDYSSFIKSELFGIYIESKLSSLLTDLCSQGNESASISNPQAGVNGQVRHRFISSINSLNENMVCFSYGQNLKLIDLNTEKSVFEWDPKKTDEQGITSDIGAIDVLGNLMAIGDYDGQIQIYDIRQKERINMFDHRPFAINALRLSNQNEVTVSFMDQSFSMDQVGHDNKIKRFSSEQSSVPVCHFVGREQITELDPQKGFVSQYNFKENQYAQLSMGKF